MVVSRERAGLNDGVPDSRAEHVARRSDQRGQGPRPGPVPRAPRGLLHPGALDGRGGRERVGRCEHRTPRPPSHAHSGPALSPHRSRRSCGRPPSSHSRRGLSAAPLAPTAQTRSAPTPHAPCSSARWAHELVSGSISSYRRGSCGCNHSYPPPPHIRRRQRNTREGEAAAAAESPAAAAVVTADGRPPPQPSPPLLPPPPQPPSPPLPTLPSVGACRRASWAPFRPEQKIWVLSGKVLIYVMKYRLPKASTQFIHTPSVCGLLWFGWFGVFPDHHIPP